MAANADNKLRIEYYRSAIGRTWRQKQILRGLGLRKLNQVVERPDNPGIRGMVNKIPHLVRILPASENAGRSAKQQRV